MNTKKLTPKLIIAILSAGILSFLGIFDESALTVTFPTLVREFHLPTDIIQWVNTLFLLVSAIIVPLSSKLKQSIATKRLFIFGMITFFIGLLIATSASNFPILLIGRLFQALGTGLGLPLMYNIILTQVPKRHLGVMMSIGAIIIAVATAIGPVFGGVTTDTLGWRWIFILSIPILLIAFICGALTIEQADKLRKVQYKWNQWLLLSIALVCLMIGFSNCAAYSIFSLYSGGLIILGLIVGYIWIQVSLKGTDALINPRLFKNLSFSGQLVAFCFIKAVTLALTVTIPMYIQIIDHGSVTLSSLIIFPGAAIKAIAATMAGKLLDKKGARLPILSGLSISLTACVIFLLMVNNLNNWEIGIIFALYYAGYGFTLSNLMTSGIAQLSEANSAQGNAIYNTLQQFSGASGTAIAAVLIAVGERLTGKLDLTSVLTGARNTFVVLIILVACAWMLSYGAVPKKLK